MMHELKMMRARNILKNLKLHHFMEIGKFVWNDETVEEGGWGRGVGRGMGDVKTARPNVLDGRLVKWVPTYSAGIGANVPCPCCYSLP